MPKNIVGRTFDVQKKFWLIGKIYRKEYARARVCVCVCVCGILGKFEFSVVERIDNEEKILEPWGDSKKLSAENFWKFSADSEKKRKSEKICYMLITFWISFRKI